MKEEFFEFRLPGQYQKDVAKARQISDKEYEKRLKKRYNRDVPLYSVNTMSKFIIAIGKTIKIHPGKMTPKLFKHLAGELDKRKQIAPDLARQIDSMSDDEISSIIRKLS
jgi:hypothetical protein